MATSNGFLQSDYAALHPSLLPQWLSNSNGLSTVQSPPPSVMLTLSSPTVPSTSVGRIPSNRAADANFDMGGFQHGKIQTIDGVVLSELSGYCRELDEKHRALLMHKMETTWKLGRMELQLESEKACKRREKMEEIELKVRAIREEQKAALDRIEVEYREQISGLRRDAEAKEQKLAEQWAAKHLRLSRFLEQLAGQPPRSTDRNS